MTTTEVGSPWLVVPVGSCEQHGPHLPLDTDTRIAVHLAERVATRWRAVVAPVIAVTASGEHAGFAGTLSIGSEVTTRVLVELARSADWAAGVVVVNAHGGNHRAIRDAVDVLSGEGRHVVWPRMAPAGDAHAGRSETSMMLAIAPEAVDMSRAEAGVLEPWAAIGSRVVAEGVAAVSPNGVLGDPRAATAAEGQRLLDRWVEDLLAAILDAVGHSA